MYTTRGLLSLAFRNLASRRLRTLVTIMAVGVGVSTILATLSINQAIESSLNHAVDRIVGHSDLELRALSENGLSESAIDTVRALSEVADVAPVVQKRTFYRGPNSRSFVEVVGIDPEEETELREFRLAEGVFLSADATNSVLVYQDWAAEQRLHRGDTIELVTRDGFSSFRIVGLLASAGDAKASFGRIAYVSLKTAQTSFGLGSRVTSISIRARSASAIPEIAELLEQRISEPHQLVYSTQLATDLRASLVDFQTILTLFGFIALMVGASLIFNTMSISVVERTREIGLLHIAGATRFWITGLIMCEAGLMGGTGSVVGSALAVGLTRGLLGWAERSQEIALESFLPIPALGIVIATTAGIGVTVVAAVFPAWQASRVSPLEALRPASNGAEGALNRFIWVGGLIIGIVGVVLTLVTMQMTVSYVWIGLGIALFLFGAAAFSSVLIIPLSRICQAANHRILKGIARLVQLNIERQPGRTNTTTGALIVSLTLIVALGVVSASARSTGQKLVHSLFPGDILVVSPVPQSTSLLADFKRTPNVRAISPIRTFSAVEIDGRPDLTECTAPCPPLELAAISRTYVGGMAIEPDAFARSNALALTDGQRSEAFGKLQRGGAILVPQALAVENGIKIGDRLLLEASGGRKSFEVAGILAYSLPSATYLGSVVISRNDLSAWLGIDTFDIAEMSVGGGKNAERFLATLAERNGMELTSINQIALSVGRAVDSLLALLTALTSAGVIVAVLGVVNTMVTSVGERRQELALLKAAGMTDEQVRAMILGEAATLGLVAGALGSVFGLLLAWMIVQITYSSQWIGGFTVPVSTLVLSLVLGGLAATIAAIYPARIAVRVQMRASRQHY